MWGSLFSALALAASLTQPAIGSAAPPDQTTVPACDGSQLKGEFRDRSSEGGDAYIILRSRNTSTTPCALNGYGDLQLITGAGTYNRTNAVPTAPGPTEIYLAPGDTADKKFHWLLYGCHEFEHVSSAVWVTPPTSTTRYLGRFVFGRVCDGFIEHSAYYPTPTS